MQAIAPLKYITVPALTKHTATVIFVHGLGDTGSGWRPVAEMFQKNEALSHVKWVFPHSPTIPVTANMGMSMPSWFDILSFGFDSDEDERGMLQTAHSLNQLITAEMDATGVPAARIVLGGFSQGGSMSLLTGLTSERRLAGVAVLSGWTPLRKKFKSMVSEHATSVPIFWGHGTLDSLVKHTFGVESVEWIKRELKVKPTTLKEGADLKGVAFNSYVGMGHSTDPKELADLSGWLQRVIPKEEEEKEAEKEKEKGEP